MAQEHPNDGIVLPVRLEFIGGTRNKDELKLASIFLKKFDLLDEGTVLPEDWDEAERFAKRIKGKSGRTRGAIDCLILAICKRIKADLYTRDTGM